MEDTKEPENIRLSEKMNREEKENILQIGKKDVIIFTVHDGWLSCPKCRRNKRLLKITSKTTAKNLCVFCRNCKTEFLIDIHQGQCYESRSQ